MGTGNKTKHTNKPFSRCSRVSFQSLFSISKCIIFIFINKFVIVNPITFYVRLNTTQISLPIIQLFETQRDSIEANELGDYISLGTSFFFFKIRVFFFSN
ncbi:hypothetical protein L1987_55411 [Smallanthus sonchifolius]|uniref:Uncharacterized protein n=1 Tax=Smallanthus sonchifolius TaxID=185202 RepID=A0ACB9EAX6_9ASTR|nr:hypothetical protein L1987_55411 [Smallanthus sonchifolius]